MAQWKRAEFTTIPSKTLNEINNKLEEAINYLNSLEKGLDTIDDLISILSLIESVVSDFFNFLLSGIIDDFNTMIEDFKYTGVYALDLTSINFVNSLTIRRSDEDLVTQFAANEIETYSGQKENLTATFKAPFVGSTGNINLEIFGGYKRQTYRQWLKIIIDAFEDENDMPSYKAWSDLYSTIGGKNVQMEPFIKGTAASEISAESPHPYELAYLRPGRPNFGPTGHIDCYIFAFAAADFITFIQTLGTLSKVFYDVTSPDEYKEMLHQYKNALQGITNNINLNDFNLFPGEYTNIRGAPPDFIGINAAQIFSPLFAALERLTNKLKSIFKTINSGIADLLDATVNALRRQIDEIREVIYIIKQLINLLADILTINNLYMLHIVSDTGIKGVIDQLENATGFLGDEFAPARKIGKKDPKMYIGGFLFCWGYPSVDSNNYNLSKAWLDRKKILKDKKVDLSQRYYRTTDTLKKLFK